MTKEAIGLKVGTLIVEDWQNGITLCHLKDVKLSEAIDKMNEIAVKKYGCIKFDVLPAKKSKMTLFG